MISRILIASSLALSMPAAMACDDYLAANERDGDLYAWGSEVDVANHGNIRLALPTSQAADQFSTTIAAYGDFECETKLEKVTDGCLLITVDWFPGADSSGCKVELSDKAGKSYGLSHVYMSY